MGGPRQGQRSSNSQRDGSEAAPSTSGRCPGAASTPQRAPGGGAGRPREGRLAPSSPARGGAPSPRAAGLSAQCTSPSRASAPSLARSFPPSPQRRPSRLPLSLSWILSGPCCISRAPLRKPRLAILCGGAGGRGGLYLRLGLAAASGVPGWGRSRWVGRAGRRTARELRAGTRVGLQAADGSPGAGGVFPAGVWGEMAPPPPAALGAGMAGEAASHCSRLFEGLGGGGGSGLQRTQWAKLRDWSPSFVGNPSLSALQRGGRGRAAAPSPPGAGAPASLRPLSEASGGECGVFPLGFPLATRGYVSAPWMWGRGALCRMPPFPPRCWSLGSRVEALLGAGVSCGLRGDPSWLKHSWSAACLPASICCCFLKPRGCPGGVVGGGGVLVCFWWKLRVLNPVVDAEIFGTGCRQGALALVVEIFPSYRSSLLAPRDTVSKNWSLKLRGSFLLSAH